METSTIEKVHAEERLALLLEDMEARDERVLLLRLEELSEEFKPYLLERIAEINFRLERVSYFRYLAGAENLTLGEAARVWADRYAEELLEFGEIDFPTASSFEAASIRKRREIDFKLMRDIRKELEPQEVTETV